MSDHDELSGLLEITQQLTPQQMSYFAETLSLNQIKQAAVTMTPAQVSEAAKTLTSREIAQLAETLTEKQARGLFGHLCLYNRLNVAMSRQKKLLVVVGDTGALQNKLAAALTNPVLRRLVDAPRSTIRIGLNPRLQDET